MNFNVVEKEQFVVKACFMPGGQEEWPVELKIASDRPLSPAMAAFVAKWLAEKYGAVGELRALLGITPESERETAEFPPADDLESAICGVVDADAGVVVATPKLQVPGAKSPSISGGGELDDELVGCGGHEDGGCCGRHK